MNVTFIFFVYFHFDEETYYWIVSGLKNKSDMFIYVTRFQIHKESQGIVIGKAHLKIFLELLREVCKIAFYFKGYTSCMPIIIIDRRVSGYVSENSYAR